MAKGAYIGISDTAKKITKLYFGVNGVAKKVKKAYIGVNGVAKLWYSIPVNVSLSKSTASVALSGGRAGTYAANRTTVFNGNAIFSAGAATTSNAYIDLISTSLTKTSLTSSGSYTYGTEDARLTSYAIIGGNYSATNSYGRYVSLSTSSTVANVTYSNSTNFGGVASETSSYAIYAGLADYSNNAVTPNGNFKAINNSLTVMNSTCFTSNYPNYMYGQAGSFGNKILAVFFSPDATTERVATIDNSLSVTLYAAGTILPGSYFTNATGTGRPTLAEINGQLLVQGLAPASPYYRVSAVTSSMTATQVYTAAMTQNTGSQAAGGSTPNAAIFAGAGNTSGTDSNKILALNSSYTDITNGMTLTNACSSLQSCVHPLGNYALFTGGRHSSTYYTVIEVITETAT